MNKFSRWWSLTIIFLISFVLAVSSAVVSYLHSSFLSTFINEEYVGFMFTVAYIVTIYILLKYSKIISRLGNFWVFMVVLLLNGVSLILLPISSSVLMLGILFSVYIVTVMSLWVNLDYFIHSLSLLSDTGRIRGINLTVMNLGWMITPYFAGIIATQRGFWSVYNLAGSLVLVVALVVLFAFKSLEKQKMKKISSESSALIVKVLANKNLLAVFVLSFILYFFYSWMVIYTPLYLTHLGFSFKQVGLMFTIMLVPFVLLQFPAGYLADKYIGETEMLFMGLVIMSLSSLSMIFVSGFWAIAIVLFMTRVGAAVLEELTDSYFYKIIRNSKEQIELINLFRVTRPLGYVVGPVIGSLILLVSPMKSLFLVLAVVVMSGVLFVAKMKDTK